MKKVFVIKNVVPFDLLRFSKKEFYQILECEYFKQFDKWIEILEADLSFIKDGIKVKIITLKGA